MTAIRLEQQRLQEEQRDLEHVSGWPRNSHAKLQCTESEWGLCAKVIIHTILPSSPDILWRELGGKPKWLPLNSGYCGVMHTTPIAPSYCFVAHIFFSCFDFSTFWLPLSFFLQRKSQLQQLQASLLDQQEALAKSRLYHGVCSVLATHVCGS